MKAACKVPPDFVNLKDDFLSRINQMVKENNIPDDLILNWDEMDVKMVPTSEWTMAPAGSKQVEMLGLDDKWKSQHCYVSRCLEFCYHYKLCTRRIQRFIFYC